MRACCGSRDATNKPASRGRPAGESRSADPSAAPHTLSTDPCSAEGHGTRECTLGPEQPSSDDDDDDDDDDAYHSADEDFGLAAPAAVAVRRSDEEQALLLELGNVLASQQSGRDLAHMAEKYGGREWALLRFLRVGGSVAKAAELYGQTVAWRRAEIVEPEPEPEPEPALTPADGPPRGFAVPSDAEMTAATQQMLAHEIRPLAPFKVMARPEAVAGTCWGAGSAGVVLLCANIDFVDLVPMRAAGYAPIFEFFKLQMELISRLQCRVRAKVGSCHGDVLVVDLRALAWRHIDPIFMHTVLVPLLKHWQAHYPETLHRAYVLNAPRIFVLIWKIIRPVLSDRVAARIVIATDDRDEELRELLQYGDEALPWLPPIAAETVTFREVVQAIMEVDD